MQRALSARLSLSSIMLTERVYSVFLCVLLISVLFFPLAAAGRVLLGTPQKEDGDHSNGRNKIDVKPSRSGQAGSAFGHSSPSHATPSGVHTDGPNNPNSAKTLSCGRGQSYKSCMTSNTRSRLCSNRFGRDCIKSL